MDELKKIFKKHGVKLDEDFFKDIQTVFEVSVNESVKKWVEDNKEEMQEVVDEMVEKEVNNVLDKLDDYVDYTVSEWLKENKIAVEQGVKVELAESFISNIKNVMEENDISVEQKEDSLIEAKEKLNKQAKEIVSLRKQLQEMSKQELEYDKAVLFEKNTKDLTESQKEKLLGLLEDVIVEGKEDLGKFEEKIELLKESFIKGGSSKTSVDEDVDTIEDKESSNELDDRYAEFIKNAK